MEILVEQWESELVQTVSALAHDKFAIRAAEHDRDGSFPHETMAELKELGIPGMALPKEIGGLNIGAEAHIRIIEEIAYGDPSAAVALNMHLLGAEVINAIPMFARGREVVEDVARNGALLCGPASVPTGDLDNRTAGYQVVEDGDDIVVNGKSGFASGSDGAKYVIVGGRVPRGEDVEPDLALCLPEVGTPGLNILGNWDAMGMRSTASHDIVCEDMRVPKSQAVIIPLAVLRALFESQGGQGGIMQNRARGALGILAIWLGNAQAVFDFTIEYVGQRHGYLAGTGLAGTPMPGFRSEESWAQVDIGYMDHWLETGRVVLYDMVRSLDSTFETPQQFTRKVTRSIYHLRRMGEEIALGSMKVCGAHAYVKKRPMERMVRDLIGGNVMAWKTDHLAMTLGQGALGMPITITGPAGS
jgi:alkylation response protein AidB-like acyl-CoA dehydrogenase